MYYLTTVAIIMLILIIPESPFWLFSTKGSNNQQAIKILNYIAWFNGSKNRVPEDALFDLTGQIIEENQTLNRTTAGILRFQVNHTLNEQMTQSSGNQNNIIQKILKDCRRRPRTRTSNLRCNLKFATTKQYHVKTPFIVIAL